MINCLINYGSEMASIGCLFVTTAFGENSNQHLKRFGNLK